ncbi:MAG: TonB-dependent receptor [Paludibacteraceae bacterium]|nr:TonB-dependent receptor [Paludibacteraceae bacterium]
MLLLVGGMSILAQTTATGFVVEAETGEPIIGASVLEVGTENGTITDYDGKFTLPVAAGATLSVSYVGYKTQTLAAGTNLQIRLAEDAEVLEEVIVTGYTTQRKADLTGSVAVMDMNTAISESNANMVSSLQGRLAGVQIISDAAPGSSGSSIRIRGMGTMNSCEPLYIIDGVPTSENLNSLNPADIESIQVLKDAASASIYGSRASNGVVIITTKNAKGEKLNVNIGYSATAQTVARTFQMLNADQWGQAYWAAYKNAGIIPSHLFYTEVSGQPVLIQYLDDKNKVPSSNTNWQDEVYRTAWTHNVNANVALNTQKGGFYFSGNYMNQQGLIKESYYERFTARINSDFKLGKWVKGGENLMVAKWKGNGYGTNSDGGIPFLAMRQHPAIPVRDLDGKFTSPLTLVNSDLANPVQIIENGKNNSSDSWRIFGNAFLEVNPWVKGLYIKTNIGIEHIQYLNDNLNRRVNPSDIASVGRDYGTGDTWTWTNTIAYSNVFKEKHHVNALLGTEAISYKYQSIGASRQSYIFETEHFMTIDAGDATTATNGGGKQTWALFSVFAKADYNYADRYLISATLRRDATSRLAKENNAGIFPAVSAAWRFTAEPFFPQQQWFTDAKIRVSWGQNGNAAISNNYASYSTYVYAGNAYYDLNGTNETPIAGIALASTGNKDLRWETTTQTNVGLDLGFFNNSLTVNFDWYLKETKDMITVPPVLSTAGEGASYVANTGDMRNMGVELNVDYHSPNYNGFTWSGNLNLGHYKNTVVKLNDFTQSMGGDVRLMVGQPMGVYYGYVADGLFRTMEEVANHADQQGKGLGRIRYRDIDGNGYIDEKDQCIIGDPNPNVSLGLNLDFKYKGFSLSMFFYSEMGFDVINSTKRQLHFMSYGDRSSNRSVDILNAWSMANTDATIPAISATDVNNEMRMSTYYVEDGSYVKMKYLKLAYDLPNKAVKAIHAQSVNVHFQIENLFTITRYTGLDPELPLGTWGARIDNGPYPRSRNFTMGVNFSF